ncbi:hypothetical protein J4E08_20910 [Sagittula sp. NFXS13]|uniref:hypothetical protein n=1 Tax=Sagittula sp. NFXS13 TaxID=2819095 RepID=UPI0032DEB1D8
MILRRKPRLCAGLGALAVFAAMSVLLHYKIATLTDVHFLPQVSWGYDEAALTQFGRVLSEAGRGGLYRNILRLDLVFMGLWGFWVVRGFPAQRTLGLAVAGAVLAFDLAENVLLQEALDWAMGRSLPSDMAAYPQLLGAVSISVITQIKIVLYTLVTGALLVRDFRQWRR